MSFFIYLSADGGCPDCSVWHFVHQYRLFLLSASGKDFLRKAQPCSWY